MSYCVWRNQSLVILIQMYCGSERVCYKAIALKMLESSSFTSRARTFSFETSKSTCGLIKKCYLCCCFCRHRIGGFFADFIGSSVRQGLERFGLFNHEQGSSIPPGRLLTNSTETVWPCLPEIDGLLCNGCDACVRLCPHEAMCLEAIDQVLRYRLYPQACTGCGVCVDVCDQQAIGLQVWMKQEQKELLLTSFDCTCCGNPMHFPAGQPTDMPATCRICTRQNHYNNLYQVLE